MPDATTENGHEPMAHEWRITYTQPVTGDAVRETVPDDASGRGAERVKEMVNDLVNARNCGITLGYYDAEETR